MLLGHAEGLSQRQHSKDHLLSDLVCELDIDEAADCSEQILYEASFKEFGRYSVQYDTIIWLSISLLLVLAWGFGIIMLLYLPYRRHVLQKDFSSRKLYVTPREIVYKVSRPSFIPFWGTTKIEKHVPLSLVIDIIIEQGCLQSIYGIHTFRVESIARGKASPVDDLQVQGISNPGLLRKMIVREASKVIQDFGRSWNRTSITAEGESILASISMEGSTVLKSPSRGFKTTRSSHYVLREQRSILSQELLLQKLEEVNRSVKKIEQLITAPTYPQKSPEKKKHQAGL
ncbi:uncharacterized protein LOC101221776 isoform X2 [Cucumis sativus]|uniref:DUF7642 domain-containing protein n=2 Tax=Cucumis sativus TaxID=3659 RepID=A0A0A0KCS4_CUCSA|nr:uncharacterized protein LOC101221776 isoform X2 [Cucumis sativus]XP_031742675.1 uncharacterized protein LOC101221776 isoform X2 [Cucumis sativus]KGN46197.1 hypothetical protein Csa_005526 [Cucumis sativus]